MLEKNRVLSKSDGMSIIYVKEVSTSSVPKLRIHIGALQMTPMITVPATRIESSKTQWVSKISL